MTVCERKGCERLASHYLVTEAPRIADSDVTHWDVCAEHATAAVREWQSYETNILAAKQNTQEAST